MAKTASVNTISNILTSADDINSNFVGVNTALQNTLSLDGSTPNAMSADIDLNGNDLINAGCVSTTELVVGGTKLVSSSSIPDWKSSWATATAYVYTDIVKYEGSSYICLVAHTSDTFSTDLASSKWELMVEKGASGDGAGDMVAASNLSDVDSVSASRTNLGLSALATQNPSSVAITGGSVTGITDLAVADGGTGASTASAAFDNLKQAATETSTGVVEKATSAEATAGTATNKFPDVASVKSMVETFSNTPAAVSSELSISSAQQHTFTHGLGSMPSRVGAYLVCKVADANWAVGDRLPIEGGGAFKTSTGIGFGYNATEIKVILGANATPVRVLNRTTGLDTVVTASSWRIVVEAYK